MDEKFSEQTCFVIMPIGNETMDKIWDNIYLPLINEINYPDETLKSTIKLKPIRIDKHDDGTIIERQIVSYIQNSRIIIADLTFERPNVYLEVGYTMGNARYNNLILCCRADHNLHSQEYLENIPWYKRIYLKLVKSRPKVHFDLQSYNILWWKESDLEKFKKDLTDLIIRRLKITESKSTEMVKLKEEER